MMGTYRAVKIVFRKSFKNQRPFERELHGIKKFEPVSRLHEGFVDVLQVGINETEGYFYCIMELGDDQMLGQDIDPEAYVPRTLASEIARNSRISLEDCLKLGVSLTHALSDLHKHNLVHRDIKPSNIIYINGTAKLADIGLVADVNDARSYVGTEGFIPPEGPGSSQADLYSLGKVLYEASTGKDRHDFPELPSEWSQSQDYQGLLELNEIILHTCQQDATRRYASAKDMQADLLVILNGKSVKRLRVLEQRIATIKRLVMLMTVVTTVAAAIFYTIYRGWRSAHDARKRQVIANISYGNRAVENGDLLAALPYFAGALRLDQKDRELQTTHRLRFGSALTQCPKLTQMWFAPTRVNDACFSPDDKDIVFAEYFGKAQVHDVRTGALRLHSFGPGDGLRSVCYSGDGQYIVTTTETNSADLWEPTSLAHVGELPHSNIVFHAKFSPDSSKIVTACLDGQVRVWHTRTLQQQLSLGPHFKGAAFAEFSHDGRLIASSAYDGKVYLWYSANGQPTGLVLPHSSWVTYLGFSPNDERLVTACHDHNAYVWDLSTGKRMNPALEHEDAVISSEFSPDGTLIMTASFDGTVRLWRADDLQPLSSNPILRHDDRLTHASLSHDGRRIISSCADGSVRIWDLAGSTQPPLPQRRIFSGDSSHYLIMVRDGLQVVDALTDMPVRQFFISGQLFGRPMLSYDGRFVVTTVADQAEALKSNYSMQIWNVATGKRLGKPILLPDSCWKADISRDGGKVVICSNETAQVWTTIGGTPLSPPLVHVSKVTAATFNPRADLIVTISGNNAYVWESITGRAAYPPLGHPVPVVYAEFSRDGRFLVTCCSDPNLTRCHAQVWNARTGQPIGWRLRHADGVLSACFSPDARHVLTSSEDFSAKVWETTTGKQVGLPLRHRHQVRAGAFSPRNPWIATVSSDKTARVWDSENSDPITPPLRHLTKLLEVRFLPDGNRLVTVDKDGWSFVWNLPIDNRPVADIVELAEFLSGGQLISNVGTNGSASDSLRSTWEHLKTKYPADFSTSMREIEAWHSSQADQAEGHEDWFAAAFHLQYLQSLGLTNQALSDRLAKAKAHLPSIN
jgi:WD40 repeat protein